MFQVKAKIVFNKRIRGSFFHLAMLAPRIVKKAMPGQFVNIRLADTYQPLLRRPFSIHRVKGRNIEILYEVIGKGTQLLSQKKAGNYLDVIGPLGNGFHYPPRFPRLQLSILVAGGMGVAPLLFLAEKLPRHKTIVLLGAKTKANLVCEKEFKLLGCDVKIATDDGSRGFKGKVTELLKQILPLAISHKPLAIYACGPRPMLKNIALISKRDNLRVQISLEEHLACGVGACLGCVVKTTDGYKRVCKDGPVFAAEQVIWKEE